MSQLITAKEFGASDRLLNVALADVDLVALHSTDEGVLLNWGRIR